MDRTEFETQLRRAGFEVASAEMKANEQRAEHSHDFEVRALVLEGSITLTYGGREHTYQAGEIFHMPAGMPHAEQVGPEGYRYVVGRRQPANA